MKTARLDYTNSGVLMIGLLLISIVAFWQSYYIVFFDSQFYIHFHAFTATLWFILLIAQPYLIKKRKLDLHRILGKISYPIAGLLILYLIIEIPIYFNLTNLGWWQSFAAWFASI